MFEHIAVPVDLAHTDRLDRALRVAADLAGLYDAKVTLMGVSASAPSAVARDPEEYARVLSDFAARTSESTGTTFDSVALVTGDLAADLEKVLNRAVHERGADLVVMASHVPTFADHIVHSHSSDLARRTDLSVFIVR